MKQIFTIAHQNIEYFSLQTFQRHRYILANLVTKANIVDVNINTTSKNYDKSKQLKLIVFKVPAFRGGGGDSRFLYQN